MSKCSVRFCDFSERRREASDEKVSRLIDLRLRRVTVLGTSRRGDVQRAENCGVFRRQGGS